MITKGGERRLTFVLEGVKEQFDFFTAARDAEDALRLLSSDLVEVVDESRKSLDRNRSGLSHGRLLGLAQATDSVAKLLANAATGHDEG